MLQKLKPLYVAKKLKEKKIILFSPLEFKRIFGVSKYAAQWFIKTYTEKELFVKIRNGLYTLVDSPANRYLIANRLYEPSYISFDTGLSFYGLIPETIYTVTSATTKTTREFRAENVRFVYHKIKKELFTGYKAMKYLDGTILIAEPEKALADYLYFASLKKRGLHYDRLDLKKIKKAKLLNCVRAFKRPGMTKLIKQIYVEFGKPKRIR